MEEYYCAIQDFKGTDIGELTMRELYDCTKVKMLRLYLCTKAKVGQSSETNKKHTIDLDNKSNSDREVHLGKYASRPNKQSQLEETLSYTSNEPSENIILEGEDESSGHLPEIFLTSENSLQSGVEVGSISEREELRHSQSKGQATSDSVAPSQSLGETCPLTIQIHRSNIQAELISLFKTPEIINTPLMVTFVDEVGVAVHRVSREAYSAFWVHFLIHFFLIHLLMVKIKESHPSSPNTGLKNGKQLGAYLRKASLTMRFFRFKLAPAFMQAPMFGEETLSTEDLCESLLLYLSGTDREVIKRALEGHLCDDDRDVFEEIVDREGCRSIPDDNQIRHVVMQLAHKCIIQNGNYALTAMQRVVQVALQDKFPNVQSIQKMYATLKPTHKRVLELLQATPKNKDESQALRFLTQFIRAQDSEGLANLMRFVTASSVMPVSQIQVEFKAVTGLGRVPVAHTCGPLLDLPCTCSSYREFRSKWQAILSSGYLAMDIA